MLLGCRSRFQVIQVQGGNTDGVLRMRWISGQYKWIALPAITLALVLSWLVLVAQGQLLPSGGLISTFLIFKSLPAFKLIEAVSYPLSAPIKQLQVGGGLLVPSLAIRRLWLLAGRVWFFERWSWAFTGGTRVFERLFRFVGRTQSMSKNLVERFDSFFR